MRNVNVPQQEASLSVLAGSLLLLSSVIHRGLGRMWRLGAGAWMVQRGVTRRCPVYSTLGIDRSERLASERKVDVAIEDSFPASDAPSFTPERE